VWGILAKSVLESEDCAGEQAQKEALRAAYLDRTNARLMAELGRKTPIGVLLRRFVEIVLTGLKAVVCGGCAAATRAK